MLRAPQVNNAGVGTVGPLEGSGEEELRRVLDTNVLGVMRAVRAVLPHMKRRRRGHIVVISSVMGRHGEGQRSWGHGVKGRGVRVGVGMWGGLGSWGWMRSKGR